MKVKTTGPYKKAKDGTWFIDTKIKINGEFKHLCRRGYDSLSSAKADYERVRAEFIKKYSSTYKVEIFDDLLKEYVKMRKAKVTDTTLLTDYSLYNNYLLPYFKGKLLKDVIKKEVISEWYNRLVNSDLKSETKNKVIARMKSILNFGYMHQYYDAQTFQNCDVLLYTIKSGGETKVERIVWTTEEEKAFLEATKEDPKDYVMFKLFLLCATRFGEFLAIQPKSIDFLNQRVIINQQIVPTLKSNAALVKKLKSNQSYRSIRITKEMCDLLEEYITTMGIKEDEFLFSCYDKKNPMSRTTFRRKLLYYCDKANVRKINPHAVRHSMACKLASVCNTGEDIETAAQRLGHTPSVFLDVYASHHREENEDKLLGKIFG